MANYINPKEMHWMRQPELYVMDNGKLILETEPYSSFHALAYDTTGAFGMTMDPKDSFVFTTKVDYGFKGIDDECGVVLKRDNTHWAKAGIEYRDKALDLACTVYSGGYGDRSCREVAQGIESLYFRILYWNGNARFQYSFNGDKFSDMRWLHFAGSKDSVVAGVYACSPGNSSFDCTFSLMQLKEL